MGRGENLELIKYMIEVLLVGSENAMIAVAEELQRFGEKGELCCLRVFEDNQIPLFSALPMFLADEKERATTRYVNITTIATFFSSVTATALQTSLAINPWEHRVGRCELVLVHIARIQCLVRC